ncbi:MAG: hypothetical protein RPU73_13095, partial [Candidatus Sedimenticola sp. (ex Thyasira tokunagai)]
RARRVSSAASRLPGITSLRFALHGWQRADSTLAVAHYGVTTPWNRTTIPRRCALYCTTASALSTLPN